jgi:hypothetical protein
LEVNNNSKENVEIEISNNHYHHSIFYNLNQFENIKIKHHDIKYNHGIIIIKTDSKFKAIIFGEYDHWFRTTHNLAIENDNIEINFINDRMAVRILTYEDYYRIKKNLINK